MARRVEQLARAKREIGEAFEWYFRISPDVAEKFIDALDNQLVAIRATPKAYPEILPSIRRAVMRQFPYLIFFRERPQKISILAFVHTARSVQSWPK